NIDYMGVLRTHMGELSVPLIACEEHGRPRALHGEIVRQLADPLVAGVKLQMSPALLTTLPAPENQDVFTDVLEPGFRKLAGHVFVQGKLQLRGQLADFPGCRNRSLRGTGLLSPFVGQQTCNGRYGSRPLAFGLIPPAKSMQGFS